MLGDADPVRRRQRDLGPGRLRRDRRLDVRQRRIALDADRPARTASRSSRDCTVRHIESRPPCRRPRRRSRRPSTPGAARVRGRPAANGHRAARSSLAPGASQERRGASATIAPPSVSAAATAGRRRARAARRRPRRSSRSRRAGPAGTRAASRTFASHADLILERDVLAACRRTAQLTRCWLSCTHQSPPRVAVALLLVGVLGRVARAHLGRERLEVDLGPVGERDLPRRRLARRRCGPRARAHSATTS